VYFAAGDLQRAGEEWERALAGKPDNLITMNALGMLYTAQGRYPEADEILHRAMTIKPGWADPHINLGTLLEAEGNPAEALTEFTKAVQLAPVNSLAHDLYGDALFKAHRYREAETELQQSLALEPETSFETLSKLSNLYLETAQNDKAFAVLQRIVAQNPYDSTAHFALGRLLEARGEKAAALEEYNRGLSLAPTNAEALSAVHRLRP
jgi:Flp pilus assembly protein TadD